MISTGPNSSTKPSIPAYLANRFAPSRRKTLEVRVGNRVIGGNAPILVQSMTTTSTQDVDATVFQALEMAKAGCELVRITAPTQKDAECLRDIVAKIRLAGCQVPISADIHFQPRAAFEALKWVEKVRINPGNFVDVKLPNPRPYDEASFAVGAEKVYEVFAPFVKEAKERGVALRIGTNHGSLSDRMMWKFGDTVEGMVESALEYLRVCEDLHFDQIVFSMKASNPRVAVQAYRLLAARLANGHKPYPFHVGVTEAGDGEDGRLKSAVGIGALLLDGLGDTVRVSLTEDPVHEIPVAEQLIAACPAQGQWQATSIPEDLNFYNYSRRSTSPVSLGLLQVGEREPIAIGTLHPGSETLPTGERKVEWLSASADAERFHELPTGVRVGSTVKAEIEAFLSEKSTAIHTENGSQWLVIDDSDLLANFIQMDSWPGSTAFAKSSSSLQQSGSGANPIFEVQVLHSEELPDLLGKLATVSGTFLWSIPYDEDVVLKTRHLAASLAQAGRKDLIVLRGKTDHTPQGNMSVAARLGSLLVDGIGDMLCLESPAGIRAAMNLGYDILQAAGVRKSKPEYVSCPSCGRTLFDLQSTTQKIRSHTAHLRNISIAIMGCIVNGPGEMADADFGYVGGAPGKVNLYVGRNCVKKNIPEGDAPQALIDLIKEHGRWVEPTTVLA